LDQQEYWRNFWLEHTQDLSNKDEQTQVLRTRNKQPIDEATWQYTLESVRKQLELKSSDTILDLCCGNGLFSVAFAPFVRSVDAVDLSPRLIDSISARKISNIRAEAKDIRELSFKDGAFTKVLWYAGIQYIDESDIVSMIRRIRKWMKPGGILFLGDVPDRSKLWDYFNEPTREKAYFDGIEQKRPVIGSWLDKYWLEKLFRSAGFAEARAIPQDETLIYSDFRYDLIAKL